MTAAIEILPITKRLLGVVQASIGAVLELVQMRRSDMGPLKDVLISLLHSTQQPSSGFLPQLYLFFLCRYALTRRFYSTPPFVGTQDMLKLGGWHAMPERCKRTEVSQYIRQLAVSVAPFPPTLHIVERTHCL